MALQAGTRVGPYKILAKLGEGGMGEVYRARDHNRGRDVAVKVLPEAFTTDNERIARFQREAQLLAAIQHPYIASVFGLETSGSTKVLAMEFVDGVSLADRLSKGPVPLDEALPIARQIAEALASAHDKGIVHRDLKPANIMLTTDGRVKVLDFGLAKMREMEIANSGLSLSPTLSIQATMAGTILGTAAYMSPEQARGRNVDKRTDVWAFGCVLFEILSGKRAFDGDDSTDVIAAVVRAEPEWTALPADLPRQVARAIRGCLVKDQKQRFGDIAVAMFLLTDDSPELAPAAAPPLPVHSPWWKRALPIAASIVVTAALVGSAGWALRPAPRAAAPVGRFSVAVPPDHTFTNTGRLLLDVAHDGTAFVYVANRRLYLRSMADTEAHAISGSETAQSGVTNPTFSPDGRQIVFFANDDAALKRIGIAGGSAVTLTTATNPLGMRWENDGIVFGQNGKGILRVSPNGGVPEVLVAVGEAETAASPQLLPGNRGVLFSLKKANDTWDQGQIVVQTPDGKRHTLVNGAADGRYLSTGHLAYAQ